MQTNFSHLRGHDEQLWRLGNAANHALADDHRTALSGLKLTWQLGLWFHRTFQDLRFKSGPFIPPQAPQDESEALRAELAQLRADLTTYQAAHQETLAALTSTAATLRDAQEEQRFWEQLAVEVEQDRTRLAQQLKDQQAVAAAQPRQTRVYLPHQQQAVLLSAAYLSGPQAGGPGGGGVARQCVV